MRRKEEEVRKKEEEVRAREGEITRRERELEERERHIEEMERTIQEMQRLKKYSGGGSSTTPGTDLGNDSCIKNAGNSNNIFNKSIDRGFFTSPGGHNSSNGGGNGPNISSGGGNELNESASMFTMNGVKSSNAAGDISREECQKPPKHYA